MLLIGCPKKQVVANKFDELSYKDVDFKVEEISGLIVKVSHNAESDAAAKKLAKEVIASLDELKNLYINIQMQDESGRLL